MSPWNLDETNVKNKIEIINVISQWLNKLKKTKYVPRILKELIKN